MSDRKFRTQKYQIVFQGQLDDRRSAWFPGMEVTHRPDGNTELLGMVLDASALHGMLNHIGDLGLPLLLVRRLDYQNNEETKGE